LAVGVADLQLSYANSMPVNPPSPGRITELVLRDGRRSVPTAGRGPITACRLRFHCRNSPKMSLVQSQYRALVFMQVRACLCSVEPAACTQLAHCARRTNTTVHHAELGGSLRRSTDAVSSVWCLRPAGRHPNSRHRRTAGHHLLDALQLTAPAVTGAVPCATWRGGLVWVGRSAAPGANAWPAPQPKPRLTRRAPRWAAARLIDTHLIPCDRLCFPIRS
jgi:hypothetical protein